MKTYISKTRKRYIIRLICSELRYSVDISEIENSQYKYLIICNALPYAWDNYYWESVLPHWTVTEFFEQLGYLLGGDFSIDHKAHSIVFRFTRSEQEEIPPCRIDKVVDSYSADVSQDNACKYITASRNCHSVISGIIQKDCFASRICNQCHRILSCHNTAKAL